LGVLERESCFYNGKKLDRGISEETAIKTPKVAEDFTGTAICYDLRDNRRTEEIEIKNGQKHGWERRFNRSTGELAEEIYNVNGKRHGVMKRYDHRNGELQQEINYEHGENVGLQKSFFSENGQLKRIFWVSKERSSKDKTEITFNKDGSLSMLSCGPQVMSIHDTQWCGRNGKTSKVVLYTYSNDERWPREIRHYKNNLLDGEVIKLHKQGYMMQKDVYDEGEKISSESYADGKPVHVQKYQSGKQKGEEVVYFEGSDQIKIAVEWDNSRKVKQIEFYQNGKPKETQLFNNDVVEITHYRENGSKYSEGQYIEVGSAWWRYMSPHGVLQYFSDEGELVEKISYSNGRRDGERRLYHSQNLYRQEKYESGKLLEAVDYDRHGEPVRTTQYFPDGSVKEAKEANLSF